MAAGQKACCSSLLLVVLATGCSVACAAPIVNHVSDEVVPDTSTPASEMLLYIGNRRREIVGPAHMLVRSKPRSLTAHVASVQKLPDDAKRSLVTKRDEHANKELRQVGSPTEVHPVNKIVNATPEELFESSTQAADKAATGGGLLPTLYGAAEKSFVKLVLNNLLESVAERLQKSNFSVAAHEGPLINVTHLALDERSKEANETGHRLDQTREAPSVVGSTLDGGGASNASPKTQDSAERAMGEDKQDEEADRIDKIHEKGSLNEFLVRFGRLFDSYGLNLTRPGAQVLSTFASSLPPGSAAPKLEVVHEKRSGRSSGPSESRRDSEQPIVIDISKSENELRTTAVTSVISSKQQLEGIEAQPAVRRNISRAQLSHILSGLEISNGRSRSSLGSLEHWLQSKKSAMPLDFMHFG